MNPLLEKTIDQMEELTEKIKDNTNKTIYMLDVVLTERNSGFLEIPCQILHDYILEYDAYAEELEAIKEKLEQL